MKIGSKVLIKTYCRDDREGTVIDTKEGDWLVGSIHFEHALRFKSDTLKNYGNAAYWIEEVAE